MDFEEWIDSNKLNFHPGNYYLYKAIYEAGQQNKQAEVDALKQQNQRLAMRLDVIQGALQKQINLIVELKNDT